MPKPLPQQAAPAGDPLDRIEWVHASTLQANHYNPNVVFRPELRLLERSILRTGWVQPILVSREGTIIDGFHRWSLAQRSPELQRRYGGLVPVARLDVSETEARCLTVRMNRAKGTHVAVRMSDLVRGLVQEEGMAPAEVAAEIGATVEEVNLLCQESIFKARNLADAPYSHAWVPREDGKPRRRKGAPE